LSEIITKFDKLVSLIADVIRNKFTGNIQINFFNGGITNVNKCESIKIK